MAGSDLPGLRLDFLTDVHGLGAALAEAAALGQIHGAGHIAGKNLPLALCFLQYIPAGIALAWSWKRSGNIFSPILMHITINALGILSMR